MKCNIAEIKGYQIIYKRYASLFFIVGTDPDDNELIMLEMIHRYVQALDAAFGTRSITHERQRLRTRHFVRDAEGLRGS